MNPAIHSSERPLNIQTNLSDFYRFYFRQGGINISACCICFYTFHLEVIGLARCQVLDCKLIACCDAAVRISALLLCRIVYDILVSACRFLPCYFNFTFAFRFYLLNFRFCCGYIIQDCCSRFAVSTAGVISAVAPFSIINRFPVRRIRFNIIVITNPLLRSILNINNSCRIVYPRYVSTTLVPVIFSVYFGSST